MIFEIRLTQFCFVENYVKKNSTAKYVMGSMVLLRRDDGDQTLIADREFLAGHDEGLHLGEIGRLWSLDLAAKTGNAGRTGLGDVIPDFGRKLVVGGIAGRLGLLNFNFRGGVDGLALLSTGSFNDGLFDLLLFLLVVII